jgi:fused signal recognition particle receptor
MFESLKKKLMGWLKTPEEVVEKITSPKKKSPKKAEKKSKKIKSKQKEITPPEKFNVGVMKFEPDIEALEKKSDAIKESEELKAEKTEQGFFSKLISKFKTKTITQEQFDEIFMELELILLENNVALEVVDKIHLTLKQDLVGLEIKKENINNIVIKSLKDSILQVLHEPPNLIEIINKKQKLNPEPYVIIFFGINGSGKTTSLAKLAQFLEKNKLHCVLAAADTFRAASIEQLKIHGEKLSLPVISSQYGADPASVAFDAISYAKKHRKNVVLIDTAGRMYTKENLMKEMEKIIRISKPDLKLFVGESITGNDATLQAKTFNEAIGIDGIILTKADVDDKAGTILSVSQTTNKPIYFLGTGQQYENLTPFKKSDVLKHLGLD